MRDFEVEKETQELMRHPFAPTGEYYPQIESIHQADLNKRMLADRPIKDYFGYRRFPKIARFVNQNRFLGKMKT